MLKEAKGSSLLKPEGVEAIVWLKFHDPTVSPPMTEVLRTASVRAGQRRRRKMERRERTSLLSILERRKVFKNGRNEKRVPLRLLKERMQQQFLRRRSAREGDVSTIVLKAGSEKEGEERRKRTVISDPSASNSQSSPPSPCCT